jgi:hypothetical protein
VRPVRSRLAVTGCSSSGDEPKSLPSLTAGSTPSATPVPVPVPGPARVHNAFGAAAFVRFYFDQVNGAFRAADPSFLAGLVDASCSSCANFVATAARFRAEGQRLEGTAIRVVSAEAPPEQNGYVAVDVFADAPARRIVRTDGSVVESLQADPRYHVTVFVKRTSRGWAVRAIREQAT